MEGAYRNLRDSRVAMGCRKKETVLLNKEKKRDQTK